MLYHEGNTVDKNSGYIVLNEISTNQLGSWMVVQGVGALLRLEFQKITA
jgi:hypothetical protein